MVGIISIIVNNPEENSSLLNELISEQSDCIKGRMGLPFKDSNLGVVVIVIDGDIDAINGLTGKIGRLPHVSANVTFPPKKD